MRPGFIASKLRNKLGSSDTNVAFSGPRKYKLRTFKIQLFYFKIITNIRLQNCKSGRFHTSIDADIM